MILLYGEPDDPPLMAVARQLAVAGVKYHSVRDLQQLTVSVSDCVAGQLICDNRSISLEKVTGVYLRPPKRTPPHEPFKGVQNVIAGFLAWTEVTPARVVNRYSAMAVNTSKPYQLGFIAKSGFAIPDTIVTTTPDKVLHFWRQHGQIVYKSVSGIRSRVERFNESHLARLGSVIACPTQFQRWIDGVDVRVHVVGPDTYATEVAGETDDYRFPRGRRPPRMRTKELPPHVARRCTELAASMNLAVAGIDLRVDPGGCWYCFEVNPSPAFTYYSEETEQPIAAAIARLLAGETGL